MRPLLPVCVSLCAASTRYRHWLARSGGGGGGARVANQEVCFSFQSARPAAPASYGLGFGLCVIIHALISCRMIMIVIFTLGMCMRLRCIRVHGTRNIVIF